MPSLVIGVVLDSGGEKGIDECGLSQARLASNLDSISSDTESRLEMSYHYRECSPSLCDNLVTLVRKIGNANGRGRLNT